VSIASRWSLVEPVRRLDTARLSCKSQTDEVRCFSSNPRPPMATPVDETPRVRAPDFPERLDWINGGGRPLALADLRGKVVLLDFWTYG
jgi:hypothetical protein